MTNNEFCNLGPNDPDTAPFPLSIGSVANFGATPFAFAQLAGFGLWPGADTSPAWRHLLAQETNLRFRLNRQAPSDLVWHDREQEEEVTLMEILRTM
jgi:hypothetical protein